jgi:YfiH family protein
MTDTPFIQAELGLPHGFFTRAGGVSEGPYASLNCSLSGQDARAHVLENRARAARALGAAPESLVGLTQVHGAAVAVVETAWAPGAGPRADAMVTARPGLALGIVTADCAPVLFADATAGVVGAAHAGWRGAAEGIIGNTIAAMIQLGARTERIIAAIGPTITAPYYEVGDQFRADFLKLRPSGERFFITPPGGKPHFDLPACVTEQLHQAHIAQVDRVGSCTYASPERYFSHRYATHQGTTTGRQISIVGRA